MSPVFENKNKEDISHNTEYRNTLYTLPRDLSLHSIA